jgi:hypothetical protein
MLRITFIPVIRALLPLRRFPKLDFRYFLALATPRGCSSALLFPPSRNVARFWAPGIVHFSNHFLAHNFYCLRKTEVIRSTEETY